LRQRHRRIDYRTDNLGNHDPRCLFPGPIKILLSVAGAKKISPSDHQQLYDVVEEMKIASGLEKCPISTYRRPVTKCLCHRRDPNHAVRVHYIRLLQKLNRDELQGLSGMKFPTSNTGCSVNVDVQRPVGHNRHPFVLRFRMMMFGHFRRGQREATAARPRIAAEAGEQQLLFSSWQFD